MSEKETQDSTGNEQAKLEDMTAEETLAALPTGDALEEGEQSVSSEDDNQSQSTPPSTDSVQEQPNEDRVSMEDHKLLQGRATRAEQENARLREQIGFDSRETVKPNTEADLTLLTQNPREFVGQIVGEAQDQLSVEVWKAKRPDYEKYSEAMEAVVRNTPGLSNMSRAEALELAYRLAKSDTVAKETVSVDAQRTVQATERANAAFVEPSKAQRTPRAITQAELDKMPYDEFDTFVKKTVGVKVADDGMLDPVGP